MPEWKNMVGQVKNPQTGKTLDEEGRLIKVEQIDASIAVHYKRDGLALEHKKLIEQSIYELLEKGFSEDDITVLSFTSETTEQARPAAAQAQLKAGHGPIGAGKKRVPGVRKVLAVSSCKGGVGKSTVAVNLCLAFKNQGLKVGLIDADIYGPSIPMLLGKRDAQPAANDQKKIVPIEAYGIHFISFGLFIKESDPVIWRGPMLGGVLNQFLFDVDWGELDVLVIDLPPGTGDMQLSMIQSTEVDGALTISTPQSVALLDSKKGVAMFNQVKIPVLGLVENMSYFIPDDQPDKRYHIFGEGGVEQAAKELALPLLAQIPLEIPLREGSDNGVPYMSNNSFEGRPVWNAFSQLSLAMIEALGLKEQKKGFLSRFF
jgi:ATP-binding protein involved in chromosome partitioning